MSDEPVTSSSNTPETRFAQNIVAETVTIVLIFLFGIASSVLIVRGLPRTPVYEFYIFVLVFSWVNILIPLGIMGMDVTLRRHVPEMVTKRSSFLLRILGFSLVVVILSSFAIIVVVNMLLVWLPPNFFVPNYAIPFLQLAIWTVPLTAMSTVLQGAFRGMQEMRYVTLAMGLYHGAYFVGLVFLFVTGTMTLLTVILVNFVASGLTIAYEAGVLQKLIRQHRKEFVEEKLSASIGLVSSTALQALFLALLGSVFVYVPLLIANMFRTSDVILAGLGLALSVAVWIQQGLAAPFRVLMPRTAGDVAQQAWETIKGYMNRAWKLGVLLCAFVAVVAVFYAAPVLIVMFAGEGMVALPFFVLMAGSFCLYPLTVMFSDSLIGLGSIRVVLITDAIWTAMIVILLWFLTPLFHEIIVALIWVVGIPFFLVYLGMYQRRSKVQLLFRFIPKSAAILALIALVSFGVLWIGSYLIIAWGLLGLVSWLFQIGWVLTLIPIATLYLWVLFRSGVFDSGDQLALLQMSAVLHPISRPATWLIEKMSNNTDEI